MKIYHIINCNINLLMDPSEDTRARDRQFIRAIMLEIHRQTIGLQDLMKACQDCIQMLQEEAIDLGFIGDVPPGQEDNGLLVIRARIWLLEMLTSALLKTEFPSLAPELIPIVNHDTEWSRILPLFLTDLIQNPIPFLLQQSLLQCSCIDRGLAKLYPTCLSFAEMIHDTLLT